MFANVLITFVKESYYNALPKCFNVLFYQCAVFTFKHIFFYCHLIVFSIKCIVLLIKKAF